MTAAESQQQYGRWLNARIRRTVDYHIQLFELSTAWCIERRVRLPAATTVQRLVAEKS